MSDDSYCLRKNHMARAVFKQKPRLLAYFPLIQNSRNRCLCRAVSQNPWVKLVRAHYLGFSFKCHELDTEPKRQGVDNHMVISLPQIQLLQISKASRFIINFHGSMKDCNYNMSLKISGKLNFISTSVNRSYMVFRKPSLFLICSPRSRHIFFWLYIQLCAWSFAVCCCCCCL